MKTDRELVCLNYGPDDDRVEGLASVDPEMQAVALAMGSRYLAMADRLLAGASEMIHLVLDPGLSGTERRAARRLALAAEAPNLGRAVQENGSRKVARFDAIMMMGPEFIAWDDEEHRLREMVASDLGWLVGNLYPVRAEGNIERLMPWLLQIAAEVTAYGAADPSLARERAERAVGRAFNALAHAHYDSWNAHGQLLTDHPAWPFLAEEVGREGRRSAETLHGPITLEAMARTAHAALARALGNMDVRIVAVTQDAD